jgi:hypothetical protein
MAAAVVGQRGGPGICSPTAATITDQYRRLLRDRGIAARLGPLVRRSARDLCPQR